MDIPDLFEAARDGDQQSMKELVVRLSPLLWQVARGQGMDRMSSEDVVQLAWLTLFRGMRQIRDPAAVIGWLVITTKREAWRMSERQRHELPTDDEHFDELEDQCDSPPDHVLLSDEQRRLWAAVGRLSRRCRELLRIVAFIPRPNYTEVGARLGMKTGSIGPTRKRCLAKLRELLDGDPEGGWS